MTSLKDLQAYHMKPRRACMIYWSGHPICRLTEWASPYSDEVAYVYTPDWKEIDACMAPDIDGLDMSLRLKNYVRYNRVPAFLYKRFLPSSRPDWDVYMERFGMPKELGRDPWELMLYAEGRVNEDDFTVKRLNIIGGKEVC